MTSNAKTEIENGVGFARFPKYGALRYAFESEPRNAIRMLDASGAPLFHAWGWPFRKAERNIMAENRAAKPASFETSERRTGRREVFPETCDDWK